jgi:hypothetical protein
MRPRRGSNSESTGFYVVPSANDQRKGVVCRCVVHIAETDEQKSLKRFTAAITHIATDGVFTAVPLQYPREASALEPRGAEVAGTATITEGMEEISECSIVWEVRGRFMRGRLQAGWSKPPCGPHCAGETHPTIKSW